MALTEHESTGDLAIQFLDRVDPEHWFRDQAWDGPCEVIDAARTDELAEEILAFIAELVALVLDAGSERDAVNESEDLKWALKNELDGWTREYA